MTSQTLVSDRSTSLPVAAVPNTSTANSTAHSIASGSHTQQARPADAMKTQYPIDQQMKFLHLQAEAESLLQHLKLMKQQRQTQLNNDGCPANTPH